MELSAIIVIIFVSISQVNAECRLRENAITRSCTKYETLSIDIFIWLI